MMPSDFGSAVDTPPKVIIAMYLSARPSKSPQRGFIYIAKRKKLGERENIPMLLWLQLLTKLSKE